MASPSFTHLHVHSHYSLLDGLGKLDNILEATRDQGMDSIALTDHGVLYGAVEWFQKASDYGVKPIIGLEGYISPNRLDQKRHKIDTRPYHVTLVAKNQKGYQNLIKLVTIAHLEGYYYKPRFDYETLAKHAEGLICLSGCVIAHIPREILSGNTDKAVELTKKYQSIFGKDNFYLEIQHHPTLDAQNKVNERVFEFSKSLEIPLVATNDVHFVGADDEDAHDILMCVQTGKKVHEKDRMSYKGLETFLKSPKEMLAAFPDHPESLENTMRIAEQCSFNLELGKVHLPKFKVPEGETPETQLRKACKEATVGRYEVEWGKASTEIKERVDYELGIIEKTGFSSYFLIVQDFVAWAKAQNIVVGPGRGSAAGSIVSYLLGITDVDPLRWELLFERFLNPARISPPDIDLDFDDERRMDVIKYVADKYGRDKVAQIITFGTIKARAAIRDTGRVLDVPYAACDKIAKMIPPLNFTLKDALNKVPDLKTIYTSDPQAKKLIDSAQRLEGVVRHASTHACGVVISDVPLNEIIPTQFSTRGSDTSEQVTTQYSLHPIEELGMLKMDFLGLSNLTIIQHTLDLIKERHNTEIDISNLPLDDKKTFELFQSATTTGVFQLESSGMKRYLRELQPTELEDIVAMVALYRPGPMEYIPTYIERKRNKIEPTYLHPKLKPILEKTYGVAIYQEQIMQIVRDLAGFSLGEADLLRKAVGKKIKKLLAEQKVKFMEGCVKNDVSKDVAEKVFAFIEPFAGYGFNRAHAVCYAMIAYQTAYLKANYPADFMAALMRSDEDNIDRLAIEIAECSHLGLPVLPPSINQSDKHFTVVKTDNKKEGIRFGLAGIKSLGSNAVQQSIAERKKNGEYESLADLLARVTPQALNKKSLESLIMSGTLDEFGERQAMLNHVPEMLKFSRTVHEKKNSNQMNLFGASPERVEHRIDIPTTEAASRMQRLKWEKDLLGLYISEQPLMEHRELIEQHATPIGTMHLSDSGQTVTIVGLVSHIHNIVTRKGDPMMFIQFDDYSGSTEVLIFPTLLKENPDLYQEDAVLIAHGKVSDKDGTIKILADKVETFEPQKLKKLTPPVSRRPVEEIRPAPEPEGSHIELMLETAFDAEKLRTLKEKLEQLPKGETSVMLRIQEGARERRIQTSYRIDKRAESLAELEMIVGKGKIYG